MCSDSENDELSQTIFNELHLSRLVKQSKASAKPVSNNAVESCIGQYKGHFSGGGKLDRNQVYVSHASLNDLQPVLLSNMKVPMVHTGCYLLCRTIVPPDCTFGIMTLIEDLSGDIEKLSLYNFRLDMNDSKWLPRGTIMLIKEPWLRYGMIGEDVMIQVDSPSDVVFLDKTDRKMLEFYNALKWHGPQTLTQEQLRLEGNKMFNKADYEKALNYYSQALVLEPDLAVIHLNKAETLIRLNRFFEAYKEAKVGLDGGGNQEKALFRMGKASYGMRSWQQALVHFETLQSLFPQSEEAKSFIERTHSRLKETSTGTFDLHELYRQAVQYKCRDLDVADYVGPIEVAEIADKGRGVIATKDIAKGTLLLVSKAFFIAYEDMLDTSLFAINTISDNLDEKTAVLNKIGVMQKLQYNPQMSSDIYDLFAGNDLSDKNISEGVVDAKRIQRICIFNSFTPIKFFDPFNVRNETKMRSTGLWTFPSYINHSCIENCMRIFYGDIMMVYAAIDIKKGDEILYSYVHPLQDYKERQLRLRLYNFTCNCELCELDKLDPSYDKRVKLCEQMERLESTIGIYCPHQVLQKMESLMRKILQSYAQRKKLQLQMFYPLRSMNKVYKLSDQLDKSLQVSQQSFECLSEQLRIDLGPSLYVQMAELHNQMRDTTQAKQCIQKAMDLNKIRMGSDAQTFKCIYPQIWVLMHLMGHILI
uniref:SET domain-containing protein n=1 Tax=Ditylenchus dipsaci TaxID=166011 RepID=A0A915CRW4_9BILA